MNLPAPDKPMFSDDDIIEMARSVEPDDHDRIAPPPQVWNNILTEIQGEVTSQEATAHRQSRSWFSSARLLSAAAVTILMLGVAVAVVMSSAGDSLVNEVAAAMMTDEGLPVSTSETAAARFLCEGDECFVEVDLTALPESGVDDLELWVINGDVSDMYSLGNVTNNAGRFALPEGVTADGYPIVDISIEPDDGDETHSGQSVLRGIFQEG
jgi:hypothetical protein